MQPDEFSEIEIVDLPEDVEEAGDKVKIVDLPSKDAKRQPERENLFKEHSYSVKRTVTSIDSLWHKQRRKINVILMVSTILLALLLLINAGSSFLFKSFVNTPTEVKVQGKASIVPTEQSLAQSTNDELMAALFRATPPGPAPSNCPSSPTISNKQHGLNQPPLKIYGFHGPQAQVALHVIKTFKSTRGNLSIWGTQLVVQINTQNPPTIWLHLSSVNSKHNPIFGLEPGMQQESPMSAANGKDADNVTPSLSTLFLNPNSPDQNNGEARFIGTNTWITSVYFSASGCYTLTAGWPNGHWQINFAGGA